MRTNAREDVALGAILPRRRSARARRQPNQPGSVEAKAVEEVESDLAYATILSMRLFAAADLRKSGQAPTHASHAVRDSAVIAK